MLSHESQDWRQNDKDAPTSLPCKSTVPVGSLRVKLPRSAAEASFIEGQLGLAIDAGFEEDFSPASSGESPESEDGKMVQRAPFQRRLNPVKIDAFSKQFHDGNRDARLRPLHRSPVTPPSHDDSESSHTHAVREGEMERGGFEWWGNKHFMMGVGTDLFISSHRSPVSLPLSRHDSHFHTHAYSTEAGRERKRQSLHDLTAVMIAVEVLFLKHCRGALLFLPLRTIVNSRVKTCAR